MFAGDTQKGLRLCACVFACVCESGCVFLYMLHSAYNIMMMLLGNADILCNLLRHLIWL